MDKMPKLFEVNIVDKDEVKSTKFISMLHDHDFVGVNKGYLTNYINADLSIALAHIKNGYKKYVIDGGWPEEKYEGVIYVIVRHRQMLIPSVILKYGMKYDEGKLTKEIKIEKQKYNKAKQKLNNKENKISQEEQELLDYIAQNKIEGELDE